MASSTHLSRQEEIKQRLMKGDEGILEVIDSMGDEIFGTRWPHGENVLHWACAGKNITVVKHLLNKGLHINLWNFRGTSPLKYAITATLGEHENLRSWDAVMQLIYLGADHVMVEGFSGERTIEVMQREAPRIFGFAKNMHSNYVLVEPGMWERDPEEKTELFMRCIYRLRLYRIILSELAMKFDPTSVGNYMGQDGSEWNHSREAEETYISGGMKALHQLADTYLEALRVEYHSEKRCLFCGKTEGLKICTKCKLARFCSIECQRGAHKVHRLDC